MPTNTTAAVSLPQQQEQRLVTVITTQNHDRCGLLQQYHPEYNNINGKDGRYKHYLFRSTDNNDNDDNDDEPSNVHKQTNNDPDQDDIDDERPLTRTRTATTTTTTMEYQNNNSSSSDRHGPGLLSCVLRDYCTTRQYRAPLLIVIMMMIAVGIQQRFDIKISANSNSSSNNNNNNEVLLRELFTQSNKIFINVGDTDDSMMTVSISNEVAAAAAAAENSNSSNIITTTWLTDAYAIGGQITTTNVESNNSDILVVLNPWNNDNYGSSINMTSNLQQIQVVDDTTTATLMSDEVIRSMYSTYRYGTNRGIPILGLILRRLQRQRNTFQYEIPVRNGYYNISFYILLQNIPITIPATAYTKTNQKQPSPLNNDFEPSFDIRVEENVNYTLPNIVQLSKQQYILNYYSIETEPLTDSQSSKNEGEQIILDQIPIQISLYNIAVRDGWLSIHFYPNTDHIAKWNVVGKIFYHLFTIKEEAIPTVSGIEISYLQSLSSIQNLTLAPVGPPVAPPVSIGPPTVLFDTLYMNVGSDTNYTDIYGTKWISDKYYIGGTTISDVLDETNNKYNISIPSSMYIDTKVLQSIRIGSQFKYNIPVPPGTYNIRMYFIEFNIDAVSTNINNTNGISDQVKKRIFDIYIESNLIFENLYLLDVVTSSSSEDENSIGSNNGTNATTSTATAPYTAIALSKPYEITDGAITIEFLSVYRNSDGSDTSSNDNNVLPILSAIEIELLGVHYAHAVSGGPYRGVVKSNTNGMALIKVNGNPSHTHAPGLSLTQWIWYLVSPSSSSSTSLINSNKTIIGTGEITTLSLPIGVHTVVLQVIDNGGNDSSETTTITVYGENYPDIESITPNNGPLFGNNYVVIVGTGFIYPPSETIVQFGTNSNITGSQIQILNNRTLKVRVPPVEIPSLTEVMVITPMGVSKSSYYSYESSIPVRFNSKKLFNVEKPLRVKFGPDGKLYISNGEGQIIKLTLDDDCRLVDVVVAQVVSDERYITGLAFDPIDPDPTRVYFAHNLFFHGGTYSTSGYGINAKISTARGADLMDVTDVVTGLPVADLDHGIMALEFDDYGSLYISSGSNTNGGIPGPLTSKSIQKDSVLSSAILVAHIHKPGFNGTITYDARDDGNQVGALGFVEVFAPGFRNPFGMVLHSNGNLYVTDNGPNVGYGLMSMGCDGRKISDVEEEDRLHLVERGKYYGQPNLKRGKVDPRQCVWRRATEVSTTANGFTPPIGKLSSSSTGVIEYQSNHFNGQLRYSLISAYYQGGLYRTILSEDGRSIIPESIPPVLLTGDDTLDITMGPDGSMFDTRYASDAVYHYKPFDFFTPTNPTIYTVFPRRGSVDGGTVLTVYGVNLWTSSTTTKVLLGDKECVIKTLPSSPSPKKIQCIIPPYPLPERKTVDVVIIISNKPNNKILFEKGYRYITGKPTTR